MNIITTYIEFVELYKPSKVRQYNFLSPPNDGVLYYKKNNPQTQSPPFSKSSILPLAPLFFLKHFFLPVQTRKQIQHPSLFFNKSF